MRAIFAAIVRVGPPERDLVDPVGLADQLIGEPERLEHLDRAAGDAVGLADLQRTVLAVDDHGPDVGERRELRGEHEPGRPGPDDQDVDLAGEARSPLRHRRMRGLDARVSGSISVQMELHCASRAGPDEELLERPVERLGAFEVGHVAGPVERQHRRLRQA